MRLQRNPRSLSSFAMWLLAAEPTLNCSQGSNVIEAMYVVEHLEMSKPVVGEICQRSCAKSDAIQPTHLKIARYLLRIFVEVSLHACDHRLRLGIFAPHVEIQPSDEAMVGPQEARPFCNSHGIELGNQRGMLRAQSAGLRLEFRCGHNRSFLCTVFLGLLYQLGKTLPIRCSLVRGQRHFRFLAVGPPTRHIVKQTVQSPVKLTRGHSKQRSSSTVTSEARHRGFQSSISKLTATINILVLPVKRYPRALIKVAHADRCES
mmetsp:Transcript_95168/g.268934  ORF Transcript_95168/g.268934 Transcript_95168/m.268934 type:complete len:262 (+) Transcript_95168:501-1286(+)